MWELEKFEGAGVGERRGGEAQLARGHMLSLAKRGFVVWFASSMVVVGRVQVHRHSDASTPATVRRASGHIHVLAGHTRRRELKAKFGGSTTLRSIISGFILQFYRDQWTRDVSRPVWYTTII